MTANMMFEFKALSGENMTQEDGKKHIMLRDVCVSVLLNFEPQRVIKGDVKVRRYKLAIKIYEHEEVNISSEDVSLLKELIGENWSPLIVGQAWEALDPTGDKNESTGNEGKS